MMNDICCIVVEKDHVKSMKKLLEASNLLNKSFRVTKFQRYFAIPVTFADASGDDSNVMCKLMENHSYSFKIQLIDQALLSQSKVISPHDKLRTFVSSYMNKLDISTEAKENLVEQLPKKWEIHNDLIMFPGSSFASDTYNNVSEQFWAGIAEIFSVQRVAIRSRIKSDDFRTPKVILRLGNDGWVQHVDNGIAYAYDVTKNMFSKGNITEKLRISKFDCSNEVVLDLFAGIGYFVLPYLLKANTKKVYACEWNPNAVLALRRNLILNNVEKRCEVREGDNREVAPKNIADRVNLGLIPSSSKSWQVACDALKLSTGGWLHVHENVESKSDEAVQRSCGCPSENECIVNVNYSGCLSESKRTSWCNFARKCLCTIESMLPSTSWIADLRHIERVKSYAPHVDHLVFDVECRPTTRMGDGL